MTAKQLSSALVMAATITVTGALAAPVTAVAGPLQPLPLAPACAAYEFPAGKTVIGYANINGQTEFDLSQPSANVDTAAVTRYPDGGDTPGSVTGYIHGVGIHLEVRREGYSSLVLDGLVGPDNRGHGTLKFRDGTQNWDSVSQFNCVANPEPEPVGPSPKKVDQAPPKKAAPEPFAPEQQGGQPGGQALGSATVIADTDIYDKPDGVGQKIGTLRVGEVHPLMEPCHDDWCRVGQIELGGFPGLPNGTAWVYAKGFLEFS